MCVGTMASSAISCRYAVSRSVLLSTLPIVLADAIFNFRSSGSVVVPWARACKITFVAADISDIAHSIRQEVAAGYDSVAAAWHISRQKPWSEWRYIRALAQSIQSTDLQILDIGCGDGRLASLFAATMPKYTYTGVDISAQLLAIARQQYPKQKFVLADGAVYRTQEPQDMLCAVASLHHVPTRSAQRDFLRTAHQNLKKDGVLFLTVWNLWQPKYLGAVIRSMLCGRGLLARIPFQRGWRRPLYAFTLRSLQHVAEEAGFREIQIWYEGKNARTQYWWRARNIVLTARK